MYKAEINSTDTKNFFSDLRTRFVGKRIHFYQIVESTQTIALSLIDQNVESLHGTVIVSEVQRNGRGRAGKKWFSPAGGVWLSIILQPQIKTCQSTVLPLLSGLCVCNVIKKMTNLNAKLKWPNDVVINGRKVSGILVDTSTEADKINFVIVGIGVNVNVDITDIDSSIISSAGFYGITSIYNELNGKKIEKFEFMQMLLEDIENYVIQLENNGAKEIIKKSKAISDTLGKKVIVYQSPGIIQGIAVDIDENDGFLLIETSPSIIQKVFSGNVLSIV